MAKKPRIQDFFLRDLAEVYLLLDNISTTEAKTLPEIEGYAKEIFGEGGKHWVEQVCEINWPLDGSDEENAKDAAKLVAARDMLNRAARPATGRSIAFTLLTSGECRRGPDGAANPAPGLWGKLFGRHPRWIGNSDDTDPASDVPSPGSRQLASLQKDATPLSRSDLALIACPYAWSKARSFARWHLVMVALLVLWLIMTTILSWDVTAGNSLMSQYVGHQKSVDDLAQQLATATDAKVDGSAQDRQKTVTNAAASQQPTPPPPVTGEATSTGPQAAASQDAETPSQRRASECADITYVPIGSITAAQLNLCRQYKDAQRQRDEAQLNVMVWADVDHVLNWPRYLFIGSLMRPMDGDCDTSKVVCIPCAREGCAAGVGTDADNGAVQANAEAEMEVAQNCVRCRGYTAAMQEVATALVLLAGSVLPILYGVLGAGVAAVRRLSQRIRDSQLLPRDMPLAWVQMALGAAIGGCVGLFTSGSGAATDGAGIVGTVGLSAAALCFLAGYGVNYFFLALDTLLKRAFNVEEPGQPSQKTG